MDVGAFQVRGARPPPVAACDYLMRRRRKGDPVNPKRSFVVRRRREKEEGEGSRLDVQTINTTVPSLGLPGFLRGFPRVRYRSEKLVRAPNLCVLLLCVSVFLLVFLTPRVSPC